MELASSRFALFLIMIMVRVGDAMIYGHRNHYKWTIEIRHLTEELHFQSGPLSHFNRPIISVNNIDTASLPRDFTNQVFDHQSTPHVAIATIDTLDRESGANSVLKSIMYNGVIPTATLTYPSPTGRNLDSGTSVVKILGMPLALESGQTNSSELCIVFPIPINDFVTSRIDFTLPVTKVGNVIVESLWRQFHIISHPRCDGDSSVGGVSHSSNGTWLPNLSATSDFMGFATSDGHIVYSFDDFAKICKQEMVSVESAVQKCPSTAPMLIQFGKKFIYLSKAGLTVFQEGANNRLVVAQESLFFKDRYHCLEKAKVSPRSHSAIRVIASSESNVFVSDEENSLLEFDVLVGTDGNPACDFLNLTRSSCKIVDVAFNSASCCEVFVLVMNAFNSSYTLMKHSDMSTNGKWSIITTFSWTLSLPPEARKIVTDLHYDSSSAGRTFTINGISTLNRPDGVIYMWGDALILFDISTSTFGWVPSFLTSEDTAIQFSSANNKGVYCILTKNGTVWAGASYPFVRSYDWVVTPIGNVPEGNLLSTFFDVNDDLFTIVLNVSQQSIKRVQLPIEDQPESGCRRPLDCQKLFVLCDAKYSALHKNHSAFSRTRQFLLKTPSLTGKGKLHENLTQVHSKKSLITFLTVVERFFTKQRISVPDWWLSNDSKEILNNWWYTKNRQLQQHRKYLYFKGSLPNQPDLYFYEELFRHETASAPMVYERLQTSTCFLPKIIYLDKDEEYSFTVVLEHPLSSGQLNYDFLRLVVMLSDHSAVRLEAVRQVHSYDVRYEIILVGLVTNHMPPGVLLKTVSLTFYPWNPHMFANGNASCCWSTDSGMAYEQNVLVKVGCPPGRRLEFDFQRSLDIVSRRGRTSGYECYSTAPDYVPCFTTFEFAAAFYVYDLVTDEKTPFEGNYTLTVVGGGVGYLENIEPYSDDEKKLYNYKPGDNRDSLIWNAFSASSVDGMRDSDTGNLIFDAGDPASIVFECRLDSPCGSIPIGSPNPAEYYFEIEVSNKGVDSSTNCDYTMKFHIRLIGMGLSPRIHLFLMLIVLGVFCIGLLVYYVCNFWGGFAKNRASRKQIFESDDESDVADPSPRELREALARRRMTLFGLTSTLPRSSRRRSSTFAQPFRADSERQFVK